MPNRLSQETSPYLLQHAHNPVDWYAWGTEALAKARREDKPIFLSIGYSACHWCHVMEKESFEDPEIAALMNEWFINIKVDREERQDLDHIYMSAVQAMTQHGGWPMSVFLTPDLEPFYGGTYFPPEDRNGMPGFKRILSGVAGAWTNRKKEVVQSAKQLSDALREINRTVGLPGESKTAVSLDLVDQSVEATLRHFDPTYGGLGSAPKFFHTMDLRVCLRHYARTRDPKSLSAVTLTLEHWANGGIYDQLGGGFHRYSTDQQWLVPHFEKMLYDNALVTEVFLEAFQITHNAEFARVARETLNYILREMTATQGGFFATQDADSEGVEGKFYVWTRSEIFSLLEAELAELFCKIYDVTDEGNWEGNTILNRPKHLDSWAETLKVEKAWLEDSLATAQRKLFTHRSKRIRPFRDEKLLASWNGLMIHTMASAYQILEDERYLEAAVNSANFILNSMATDGGGVVSLTHVYKDGRARFSGYLDDYANLAFGLLTLYESNFDLNWLSWAERLCDAILDQFWDEKEGTFYYTARHHEQLITRPKEVHDGATPSATAMAISALVRVGRLTGNATWLKPANQALSNLATQMATVPTGSGQLLISVETLLDHPREIAVVEDQQSEAGQNLLRVIRQKFLPNKVVAYASGQTMKAAVKKIPLLANRSSVQGKAAVYVCENYACKMPVTDEADLGEALEGKDAV
jgi:uncharacterized protein